MSAARLKLVTSQWLTGQPATTRSKSLQYIRTWQKFCDEQGLHILDVQAANAEAFVDWMKLRYTPSSVRNRAATTRRWLDELVDKKVIKAHGFGNLVLPTWQPVVKALITVTEEELTSIMAAAATRGPRVEWLVTMLCLSGAEMTEVLKVKSVDVRSWDGHTLVKVSHSRRGHREIPVNGRLEVLTVGLAAVFAPTTTLAGMSIYRAGDLLQEITSEAIDREVSSPELRLSAVRRQYDRGVAIPVIARWLGFRTESSARSLLGLPEPVGLVHSEDVLAAIVLEDDGDRFGSGLPAEVSLDALEDERSE